MKRIYQCALAAAAGIAALASALPAQAQATSAQGIVPITVSSWPDEAKVASLCKLDASYDIGRLQYPSAGDFYFGETLTVSVTISSNAAAFDDLTPSSQQAGTPGVEAVVAGASRTSGSANVYCRVNLASDSNIRAPGTATLAVLDFYWSRGPCLVPQANVANACNAYNLPAPTYAVPVPVPEMDPALQRAHYLQEHLVAPVQPINLCGCPYDPGEGVIERIAKFCDPSLPATLPTLPLPTPVQGSCFVPDTSLTGFESQASATSGTSTCRQVVIGGRAIKIGDTCTP
jgi:hypothetical protein